VKLLVNSDGVWQANWLQRSQVLLNILAEQRDVSDVALPYNL
jgi:hypothetical protein